MKLHVGCGKKYIPGFVHVDIAEYGHIDYRAHLDQLPFEDGAVDLIYCCHALTYYDFFGVAGVLKEWLRVLKPSGIARVSVTNFDALRKIYIKEKNLDLIIGPLFGRWEITSGSGEFIYHKTIFDESKFTQLLYNTGFGEVRNWDWRITEHAHIDDYSQAYYPHMNKENGIQVSLNLEGIK